LGTDWQELGGLKPNEKVALCLDMTEACFRTCIAGISAQNPDLTEEEIIAKFHERIDWIKHSPQRGKKNGNSGRVH
jgi:hypothetical protein